MKRVSFGSGNGGFTLVEVLIATLLMVFILSALAMVTAQWLPNWNRGLERTQRGELIAIGLDRLVADLAAAEFVSAGNRSAPPIFDGTPLSVTFIRTALGPNAGAGLEIVRIGETTDEHDFVTVRKTAPFVPINSQTGSLDHVPFANPVVVIRAPYRVSFAYAGADRRWQEEWRGKSKLPRAVRIKVRDTATSQTLAVSTSALIWVELPSSCASVRTTDECPVLGGVAKTSATADDGTRNPVFRAR